MIGQYMIILPYIPVHVQTLESVSWNYFGGIKIGLGSTTSDMNGS